MPFDWRIELKDRDITRPQFVEYVTKAGFEEWTSVRVNRSDDDTGQPIYKIMHKSKVPWMIADLRTDPDSINPA